MMRPDPANATEFQNCHPPLTDALYREMSTSIQPDWSMTVLEADVIDAPPGRGTAFSFCLHNPASRQSLKDVQSGLTQVVTSIHAICCEYLHLWVRATFTVIRGPQSQIAMALAYYDYAHLR
jgi:hypothetical protein